MFCHPCNGMKPEDKGEARQCVDTSHLPAISKSTTTRLNDMLTSAHFVPHCSPFYIHAYLAHSFFIVLLASPLLSTWGKLLGSSRAWLSLLPPTFILHSSFLHIQNKRVAEQGISAKLDRSSTYYQLLTRYIALV